MKDRLSNTILKNINEAYEGPSYENYVCDYLGDYFIALEEKGLNNGYTSFYDFVYSLLDHAEEDDWYKKEMRLVEKIDVIVNKIINYLYKEDHKPVKRYNLLLDKKKTPSLTNFMLGSIGYMFKSEADSNIEIDPIGLYDWLSGGETFEMLVNDDDTPMFNQTAIDKLNEMLTELDPLIQQINKLLCEA
ncbi:MAG: hypothetical protein J6T15_04970 [Bacilli bacterium]|nr:hypothetical protein [Bacilli bacterium]